MDTTQIPVYRLAKLIGPARVAGFEWRPLDQAFAAPRCDIRRAHRHDYFELFWLARGAGVLEVDFRSLALTPPLLCAFVPGQVHSWRIAAPIEGAVIRFTREFFSHGMDAAAWRDEAPLLYDPRRAPVIAAPPLASTPVAALFEQIGAEYQASGPDSPTVLRAFLHILLIQLKRLRESPSYAPNDPGAALAARFLMLVEEHAREPLSAAECAARLAVSADHLHATVRRVLGNSVGEVIRDRRLLEAKRLLRYSDLPVATIAAELHFEDPAYFSRFFKRYAHLTPLQFRSMA